LIVRFAVATLPAASVASAVTFARTFLPSSSALMAFFCVLRGSPRSRVALSPGARPIGPSPQQSRHSLSGLAFLTFVSFPSALRLVHASSPQLASTSSKSRHSWELSQAGPSLCVLSPESWRSGGVLSTGSPPPTPSAHRAPSRQPQPRRSQSRIAYPSRASLPRQPSFRASLVPWPRALPPMRRGSVPVDTRRLRHGGTHSVHTPV
jgi:hypothetical protein